MRRYSALVVLALVTQVYTAPQFITFKDGKLGVNFGGYHAGVGIGGLLNGGSGGAGGLYAEAGTPHGPAAKAGLGGVVDGNGGSAGGLYAGATAGGNVRAAAGLGGIAAENAAGGGFATAQAGNHHAASGLGGASSVEGSAGFKYAGATKSYIAPTVVKEVAVIPIERKLVESEKKAHAEFNFEAANELKPLALSPVEAHAGADANVDVSVAAPQAPTVTVIDESQPPSVTRYHEKHIVRTHYKPHKHHVHKTAYIGGYVGADVPPPPQIQKRVDVGVESAGNTDYGHQGAGQITSEVTIHKNPTFFQDIFNIPISVLKAVGNLVSNTAGSTNVSVQKSASVHAESDSSPKHAASSSSSEAHISVETPSASQIFDDILAIPINTLGAVNKFLENNVANRKRVTTVIQSDSGEPTRVRLGPHARRRLNKQVVIVEEKAEEKPEAES